jgi:hypothetical protein
LTFVFSDGLTGELDLRDALTGPMLEPLHDPAYFARVRLDEYGAPVWPNGVDFAPDSLHDRLVEPLASAHGRR